MNVTKPAGRDARRIAADTIVLLLRAGVVPYTPRALAAAANACRLTVPEIEDAYRAVSRDGHRPATAPRSLRSPEPARPAKVARTAVAVQAAKQARGNERPAEHGMERRCCRCRVWFPSTTKHFYLKDPGAGRLSSMCRDCRKEYQRERYLTVRKVESMNAVGLGFLLADSDDITGLECPRCGQPLHAGEEVHGSATLTHTNCPESQR